LSQISWKVQPAIEVSRSIRTGSEPSGREQGMGDMI